MRIICLVFFALGFVGCMAPIAKRNEILRAQESNLLWHYFSRDESNIEKVKITDRNGRIAGRFIFDNGLCYETVPDGKKSKVWVNRDYGDFLKLSQSADSMNLYLFYTWTGLFGVSHTRMAVIEAHSGQVKQSRLNGSDFAVLSSTRGYTNTGTQPGGPAEATAGENSPLPPR